jgi:hypothetical protein
LSDKVGDTEVLHIPANERMPNGAAHAGLRIDSLTALKPNFLRSEDLSMNSESKDQTAAPNNPVEERVRNLVAREFPVIVRPLVKRPDLLDP